MLLKVNTVEMVAYPHVFQVTPIDVDNGESSVRTADAHLTRDRVAIKRQIDMTFGVLTWVEISSILTSMAAPFFSFYYPDPMSGTYLTKTFYVGNRPSPVGVSQGAEILWNGLKIILTEQ